MYSALGSSEIQETDQVSNSDIIATSDLQHEEGFVLPAIIPLAEPSDAERTPWSDTWVPYPHPTKYLEATTIPDNYTVEARLLYPSYRPTTKKFEGNPDDKAVFMKKQNWSSKYRHHNDHFAECTAQEVKRCEQINRKPHRNLAQYLGVETQKICGEERVTRIAYKRYSMDLHTFVLEKRLLKPHHIPFLMHGIRQGIKAIHAMELVHCDLRPANIFVTVRGEGEEACNLELLEVVLGDFDASVMVGEEIRLKRASSDWWPENVKYGMKAQPWIDEWCLKKMGMWLEGDWKGDVSGGYDDKVLEGASNVAQIRSGVLIA